MEPRLNCKLIWSCSLQFWTCRSVELSCKTSHCRTEPN